MLGCGFCLVQARQCAVVALVQTVVADDGHPHLVCGLQRQPQRLDRALEHGRIREVELEALGVRTRVSTQPKRPPNVVPRPSRDGCGTYLLLEQFTTTRCLGDACRRGVSSRSRVMSHVGTTYAWP